MLNNNCRETPAERMMIFFNRFVNTKTIDLFDNFGVEQVYEFKTVSRRSCRFPVFPSQTFFITAGKGLTDYLAHDNILQNYQPYRYLAEY